MLRDKNLIPLSHQHQHALALCVRIDRAAPIAEAELPAWLEEIGQIFQNEIQFHFAAEESVLFPAARKFPELGELMADLHTDHDWLRAQFGQAMVAMNSKELHTLAERLSAHIRKEERLLFERLQQLMSAEEIADIGAKLEKALEPSVHACALPKRPTQHKSQR